MDNLQPPPIDRIRLQRGKDNMLELHLDGQCTRLDPPKRALPLTDPDHFIVLYDDNGRELFMLDDLAELEADSKVVLYEALEQAYCLERITRIISIEKDAMSGQTRWRVELVPQTATRPECYRSEDGKLTTVNGHAGNSGVRAVHSTAGTGKMQEREFCVNGQEDVQTARYPHIFIVDTEHNRYEIVNCDELDPASRRAAEVFF